MEHNLHLRLHLDINLDLFYTYKRNRTIRAQDDNDAGADVVANSDAMSYSGRTCYAMLLCEQVLRNWVHS